MNTPIRPFLASLAKALFVLATFVSTASAAENPAPNDRPQAKPGDATAAAPAGNVVYKWKDAHGVSQYSQQPPPKGVKYEVIQNNVAPENSPAPAASKVKS